MRLFLTTYQSVSDVQRTFFEVLARHKGQKLIFFGRVESNSWRLRKRDWTPSVLSLRAKCLKMMENMGYDLTSGLGLNFGKGRRTLLRSFIPKGKAPWLLSPNTEGVGLCVNHIPSTS